MWEMAASGAPWQYYVACELGDIALKQSTHSENITETQSFAVRFCISVRHFMDYVDPIRGSL